MYFYSRPFVRIVFPMIISLVFVVILVSMTIKTGEYLQYKSFSFPNISSKINQTLYRMFNNKEDERTSLDDYSIWCLHMANRLDFELSLPQSPIIQSPPVNSTRLQRFPYRYSLWKSSPRINRLITPCEHSLTMRLLMIVERICRKHKIPFMLIDGTLLGSWRHHDIIPWDDDLDIMIPIEDKERFVELVSKMNETLIKFHILSNKKKKREYYKIYLKNTPSAGPYSWNFPFLDIYLYEHNETHIWQMKDPDTLVQSKYVFPLVMRPLGELWLPAPRRPDKLFSFDPYDECKSHYWDHKNETGKETVTVKCNELKSIYPFVERTNKSNSNEILKLNNTIIHTIIFN